MLLVIGFVFSCIGASAIVFKGDGWPVSGYEVKINLRLIPRSEGYLDLDLV